MTRHNATILMLAGILGVIEMVTALRLGFANPVLGVLFALILPGYTVSSAIFNVRRLSTAERLLLAVGLSVALAILGGLALNLTPWGLRTASWGAFLGGVTACGSIVALIRSRQPDKAHQPTPLGPFDRYFASPLVRVMALAAVILVATAFAISLASVRQTMQPGFTQLWMLPSADSQSIQVGVRSHENGMERYTVEVLASGKTIHTWTNISLAPGQSWTTYTVLPKPAVNSPVRAPIRAILYLADAPDHPYRQTLIWVGGAG